MREGKHVVLCVDDDPDILAFLRTVLESAGYEMVGAESAESALHAYKDASPDLLLVDLMMEEVDAGTSLVTQLRALGNKAPIYMLSSVGDDLAMTTDHTELGLSGVLQKPVSKERLLAILKAKLA